MHHRSRHCAARHRMGTNGTPRALVRPAAHPGGVPISHPGEVRLCTRSDVCTLRLWMVAQVVFPLTNVILFVLSSMWMVSITKGAVKAIRGEEDDLATPYRTDEEVAHAD
eukprot:2256571-Pyramimonas_sp.AAC.3